MIPAHLKTLFIPPHFADEEKTWVAGLLYGIALILLAMLITSAAIALLFGEYQLATILVVALPMVILNIGLTRQGYVGLAAMLVVTMILVFTTYIAYLGEGIHAHTLAFTFVIVMSSFILKRYLFVLTAVLCMLAVAVLTLAEVTGIITTSFSMGNQNLTVTWSSLLLPYKITVSVLMISIPLVFLILFSGCTAVTNMKAPAWGWLSVIVLWSGTMALSLLPALPVLAPYLLSPYHSVRSSP